MQVTKPSLKELIDTLVQTAKPIPPSGVVLKNPFPRPDYYFLHESITILKKLGRRFCLSLHFTSFASVSVGFEDYSFLDGEFGEVNMGRLRQKTGEEIDVAVKMLRSTRIKKAQLSAFFEVHSVGSLMFGM